MHNGHKLIAPSSMNVSSSLGRPSKHLKHFQTCKTQYSTQILHSTRQLFHSHTKYVPNRCSRTIIIMHSVCVLDHECMVEILNHTGWSTSVDHSFHLLFTTTLFTCSAHLRDALYLLNHKDGNWGFQCWVGGSALVQVSPNF